MFMSDVSSSVAGEHNSDEGGGTLPRKEAWIQVVETMSSLSSSIFSFASLLEIGPSDLSTADQKASSEASRLNGTSADAATAEVKPRQKKRVSFSPETTGSSSNLDHVVLIDAASEHDGLASRLEQHRQAERSYAMPQDLPAFGWRDVFQLGIQLTHTTLCLRRNISPRCLDFDEQQGKRERCPTVTQVSVLAREGLAFNCSTEALIVRQVQPPPPITSPPKKKRPRKRRRVRVSSRLGLGLGSKLKWTAKAPKLLPATANTSSNESAALNINSAPPKPQVKLKASLTLKLRLNASNRASNAEKPLKGPDKNKIGSCGAIGIFRALRVNSTLVSLCLENAAIDDSAMPALAAALRVNATLTHLNLIGNRIGPAGARDLADALEDSPDSMLLDLNLRGNRLGSLGAEELGRALRENETLTRCDFSWNQMGPQALLSLLSSLRDNFVLRELCVYGRDLAGDSTRYLDNIDYDSAKRIVIALRHLNESFAVVRLSGIQAVLPIDKLKTSRWISLPGRELAELDGLVIAGLIPLNTMLLSLDLHDNPGLGQAAVLALLAAIKRIPTLRDVNLSNVGLFSDAGESVGELVALNTTLSTIVMHETVLRVQQVRGNRRAGEVPETMTFSIASSHFLDRWIVAKCFAVNRLTQELNGLRLLPAASSSMSSAAFVQLESNQKERSGLATVNLSGRQLELHEVSFLGKKMLHHLHLGRAALNSCALDGAAARALAEGIRNHASLHTLELENNPLGPIGGKALAECLAVSPALTYLNLSWTQLGDDGVIPFREALTRNKSIERLDLRGNELRVRGVIAIAEGLRRTATLQELHLRWNSVSPAGAEALAVALEINKSLRLLDIEHHVMGSRGAVAFASMLEHNKYLEHLNMSGTDTDDELGAGPGIGSEQAKRVAEALVQTNRSLRVLHIGANRIDADAAAQFGEILTVNKVLTTLDLSRSGLDAKRSPRFFACLSVNSSLTHLSLAYNHIGNEGFVACIRALETNRALKELNLAYNGMTEEPLALLVSKLQTPKKTITPTLEWLCLTGNKMTVKTRDAYLSLPTIAMEINDNQDEDAGLD